MFKIDMENGKEFSSAVEALCNLIDEGTFTIRKDGIGLHALDPSQIAMVIFSMPASSFAELHVDDQQNISLNLDNLNKILARGKGSRLTLFDEENKVVVQFADGRSKKSFKIPTIDIGPTLDREPKVEHDVSIIFKTSALKEAVRDIALVSSHINFDVRGKKVKISATGDNAEAEIEYEEGEEGYIKSLVVKNAAKATFPVQYLEDMIKGADDSADIEVLLRTNAPIKIRYAVGNAKFTYYLAPRIDLE